jgi:hypothetical protein
MIAGRVVRRRMRGWEGLKLVELEGGSFFYGMMCLNCWTVTRGVWAFVPGLEIFLQKKFTHELDSTDWHE